MKVDIDRLRRVTRGAILASGYAESDAEIILEIILYAQLRGNNQNVIKLVGAGMPADSNAGAIRVLRETQLSALLDGGWRQGMVVMNRACDMAVDKALAHGFGIVGIRGTNSPTGAIGYYARRIADAGLLGFVFSGAPELMAMHGSYEAFLGTNPLAIGIPTADSPIVLDMATAAIAWYGVVLANAEGKTIPDGVAYDADGNVTTDAAAALAGAIKAFGGYKGAGLALIVEILTRPLVGARYDDDGNKLDWGDLIFAIDPTLLADDLVSFRSGVSDLISRVKALKRLPDVDEILAPGERGDRFHDAVMAAGEIDIDAGLWRDLKAVARMSEDETNG